MKDFKYEDSLLEEPINIPEEVLNSIKKMPFKNMLYITHVGYFPNKREKGSNDYVLIYCLTGKGQCETQNGTFVLRPNQFILLPPNEYYCYQADIEQPWTIYCMHFNGSMINELNESFDLEQFAVPTNLPFNNQILETWKEIYTSLLDGYTDENIGYANLCLYRFVSFFLFPNRSQKTIQEPEQEDLLDQSISFMKANVHKRFSVDEIAETFQYSPSHYSVLFKQKTGLSPIDYFIKIKIQHACELLTGSNLIVKEIAVKVGYEDPYYFTRIFKKVTGKTPREYKEVNRLGNKASFEIRSNEQRMAV
ncbi:AraC family transcriptional regulator [Solitalea koreensis]|uniref:Transcriptional regulator, AraC family n=1 Tax=Solitalea koreensis TaxID=543615 RepID=A0A521DYS6_9SPHI|nr:AraC family transcriptional regulator [Solitalea koreensis]SMO76867.1 transcriptional regulator, AraC family [Solitalea koreensis]